MYSHCFGSCSTRHEFQQHGTSPNVAWIKHRVALVLALGGSGCQGVRVSGCQGVRVLGC